MTSPAPPGPGRPRVVLASGSPARLRVLRDAGLDPEVVVSGVDESAVHADTVPGLVAELARCKAEAVAAGLPGADPVVLVGCDSLLELDGEPVGKPGTPAAARKRWHRLRGRSATLHTGHHVLVRRPPAPPVARTEVASTVVHFADPDDAEIDAYVATGEPLEVAGGFTIDGLGGAFVRGVEGDPHNVVGLSLPLLRRMLAGFGVGWTSLWAG